MITTIFGIGFGILLLYGFISFLIKKAPRNTKHKTDDKQQVSPSICFQDLIQDVTWSEIAEVLNRFVLYRQRDLERMHQSYKELLQIQPLQATLHFQLFLHMSEERQFIDVYTKEQGDPYTEYMIDHDDWRKVLSYHINSDDLQKYGKLTFVTAVLYCITSVGYSRTEVMNKKQAITG